MILSPDQSAAKDAVMDWYGSASRKPLLTLGGFAGTGKTSTLGEIAKSLGHASIAYVCFTGKASLVLASKLRSAGVDPEYCGTIHSLIYKPNKRVSGQMTWTRVDTLRYDLIVIDEASMIGEDLLRDLQSYGIPILAVGDHGQLPPVSGKLNLMESPDIKLEHIHRQAEGSAIIRLSMMARLEGRIPVGNYGPGVLKTRDRSVLERLKDPKAGIILCGTNSTRVKINAAARARMGHSGMPESGERIVCLRNDRENGIYNGSIGEVVQMDNHCPLQGTTDPVTGRPLCKKNCDNHYSGELAFDGEPWFGPVVKDQFGSAKTIDHYERTKVGHILGGQFDFAYAVTVHKFQGSEADNVIVVEETGHMRSEDERRRWTYTAVTRAKSKLMIIGT